MIKKDNIDLVNERRKTDSADLTFKKHFELKNLVFRFPNKKAEVLKHLNLRIDKGKTIGIIGSSGAGKTTLLNILLRLYEENEGGIYVDGVKINHENLQSWYKLVSYVPQNITLLDATLIENIAFGVPVKEIDYDKLKTVLCQAQLDAFVSELPNGYNTAIGEKGVKISGGQRQRIGIARALYHGGEIIIFDEATSSLDIETEKMLTESINSISHGKHTIIIVAHRMQTLKYCDTIYQLKNGTLHETQNVQYI